MPIHAITSDPVTAAQLMAKMAASELIPGQQYLITDFQTVHYIVDTNGTQYLDTIITGTTEPLLVTAIAANKLSHEAKSALYPQDIIHYDPDFSNWDQDIAFADLTDAENPVAVTGFKGVIYFRHDTLLDNYMPYDFRNCKFRRWNDGTGYYAILSNGTGVTDANDFLDQKTFVETGATGLYEICCRGNHFDCFKDSYDLYYIAPTRLLNIIVYLRDDNWLTFMWNTFGAGNYHHTFKGYTESVAFGTACYGITLGDGCYKLTFFQGANELTFGASAKNNRISEEVGGIDFTSATHVYANYNCEIFRRADGTAKLSYVDNTDTLVIVDATA